MNTPARRAALPLALILGGCGAAPSQGDAYKGVIDGSALDAKLLPGKCGSQPCYQQLTAYAKGSPVYFYLLGAQATSTLPPLKAANAPAVYRLPDGQCEPVAGYDPMRDAYPSQSQFPIFTALPTAARAGVLVLPFVSVVDAVGAGGFPCNAVKDATSVATDGGTGRFGLQPDPAKSPTVSLWAVVDPAAPLNPASPDSTLATAYGWYRGLLLTYLDGGPVPVSAGGELQAMDGVILDPAGVTTFAKPTDPKVVLLPYRPGEPGYSPIVRLHSWRLPAGRVGGDYTGLCLSGMSCGPKEVNFTQAAPAAFNTIFIAAQ